MSNPGVQTTWANSLWVWGSPLSSGSLREQTPVFRFSSKPSWEKRVDFYINKIRLHLTATCSVRLNVVNRAELPDDPGSCVWQPLPGAKIGSYSIQITHHCHWTCTWYIALSRLGRMSRLNPKPIETSANIVLHWCAYICNYDTYPHDISTLIRET